MVTRDAMEKMSLRERKRIRTRDALVNAAMSLFLEKGFASTTVDEIVERAEISRRTFFRYFASKEAVVFPHRERYLEAFREVLRGGTYDEKPLLRLSSVVLSMVETYEQDREQILQQRRVIEASPALRTHELHLDQAWEDAIVGALLEQWGEGEERRQYAMLLAACLMGAVRATLDCWYDGDGTASLRQIGEQHVLWLINSTQDTQLPWAMPN